MRRSNIVPAFLFVTLLACGGNTNLRPSELTAEDALGKTDCDDGSVPGDSSPLIVHWDDEERAALESSMSRGVAVVRYECSGITVLRGCSVAGSYDYQGNSPKTRQVAMKDQASLAANFGSGLSSIKGIETEFKAGRSLDLAYVLVGSKTTTVSSVASDQLVGRCDGATHFVHGVSMGAFAMSTSAGSEAKAAAEIFGRGASGEASSTKKTDARDGDLASCNAASTADKESVSGCQALLHSTLFAIDVASGKGRDARTCPDSFAYDKGVCVPTAEVAVAPCAVDDPPAICQTSCQEGNTLSCGRLATAHNPQLLSSSVIKAEKKEILSVFNELIDPLSAACDDGEASACSAAAFAKFSNLTGSEKIANQTSGLKFAVSGCVAGDGYSCSMVRQAFLTGAGKLIGIKQDTGKFTAILAKGCAKGSALPCGLLGELYAVGLKVSANQDIAQNYLQRGCLGGDGDACFLSGVLASSKDDCSSLSANVSPRSHKKRDNIASSLQSLCGQNEDADKAKLQLTQACKLGTKAACL